MKITKFGHCCLLIEEGGVRILTDPGIYSTQQNEVKDIGFVLITHEHTDHFNINSLKEILINNPQAKIITNKSVGLLLEKESIAFSIVEDGQTYDAGGVLQKLAGYRLFYFQSLGGVSHWGLRWVLKIHFKNHWVFQWQCSVCFGRSRGSLYL